jgi:hypothetical protein
MLKRKPGGRRVPAKMICGLLAAIAAGGPTYADVTLKNAADKLTIGGEVRARGESRQNFDLNETRDDENSFIFLRSRFNVKFDATDNISAFIQFQDARTFGDEASTLSDDASADVRQAYFDARQIFGSPVAVRVGRQELSYGSERLVGAVGWSNVGRSFDAVKFTMPIDKVTLDLFGSTIVETNANDNDLHFYGLVGTYKDTPVTFMPYVFVKRDGRGNFTAERSAVDTGNMINYTAGAYLTWKIAPSLTLDAEGAYQGGEWSSDEIDAWAGHVGLAWRITPSHDLTLYGEGNWASGDDNATDGTREAFDNLYPTNHKFYGYADFFQWSNIENYRLGLSFKPVPTITAAVDYHLFMLDTTRDAWRNAVGGTVRAANSFTENDIASEIDLTLTHKWGNHFDMLIGASHLWTDQVMTGSGQEEDAQFYYLQTRAFF